MKEIHRTSNQNPSPGRLPAWLKRPLPPREALAQVRDVLAELRLATVCSSAHCPNLGECFSRRQATFLILGDRCTRRCGFCAVSHGQPLPVQADEPQAVAEAAARLGLAHVVITSVTRDDLADGGAGHFAATIVALRQRLPQAAVEVLTPDFGGDAVAVQTVLAAGPAVLGHNIETVPRLYARVRPQADYQRSLAVLEVGRRPGGVGRRQCVKSGIMLGLGETQQEVAQVLGDLRRVGVAILTIGQYLAPSPRHAPVARFVPPEKFADLRRYALAMGFAAVAAGPLVRSSYNAQELLSKL